MIVVDNTHDNAEKLLNLQGLGSNHDAVGARSNHYI